MPWFECPECGDQKFARDWVECGNKHYTAGMYKVLDWGKYPRPNREVTEQS